MTRKEKLNGQYQACYGLGKVVGELLYGETRLAYEVNRYASENHKKAMRHELMRIWNNLGNREAKLLNMLMNSEVYDGEE